MDSEAEYSKLISPPVIDVMVLYTNQAAASTPDLSAHANNAVQWSNETLNNSNINATLNFVHAQQVDYNDTGFFETDLDRLVNPNDGYIDFIHSLREWVGADIVVMLTSSGNYCGLAADIEATSNLAFAIAKAGCVFGELLTFPHEIGHLIGGRHDVDPLGDPRPYAHGYVSPDESWQTVMSISGSSARIPYWSSPDILHPEDFIPMGTAEWNDVRRVWIERAPTVAGFMGDSGLSASIGGISLYNPGETGHWFGSASNGTEPYNFTWYRSYSSPSSGANWSQVGTGSTYSQTVTHEMWLKLVVTDANMQFAEDILWVRVTDCTNPPCPTPKIIDTGLPEHFSVASNFPNPFNPSTTISFELPEISEVELKIYDLLGRPVTRLLNEEVQAGRHQVVFDASQLSSGTYLAVFEARGVSGSVFNHTLKMQLIK